MPLRARAVPEGSNQAESIHFLRTRLGFGIVRKSVRCEVVSISRIGRHRPTRLLGSCHRVLRYTVIAAAAIFKWVDLARARARVSLLLNYRT